MPLIRPSQVEDLKQITALYAHHVLNGTGTFEIEPPTVDDMAQRRLDVVRKGLPYLVAIESNVLIGFAYCNWFKPRPAYKYSAEDSIYIDPTAAGQGLGRALLGELMIQAESTGVRKMIAVIGDSRNNASLRLHRAVGFTNVGTLKSCGWKFQRWLDVVLMEKSLGFGDNKAPE